ncbi:TMEM175 family protein [Streptococcus devriesei]|uniref:TMEM175 family protein n=1 Tax=Streptococcus devriesei TaxID=231233 RepID=UPI0004102366|nr:TMEM175 family protein [Streptococcus devriesei]
MSKERLTAFTDAVLAIIMTILILELEKPAAISWSAFWDLRMNFFAYTVSFFWLGAMWVNLHQSWHEVEKITNKQAWQSLFLLFFASFFPYATSIVATHFESSVAQGFYGLVVLLVSFSNVWMYNGLAHISSSPQAKHFAIGHNRAMVYDITVKLIGLALSLTVYPPAMMYSVVAAACFVVGPLSERFKR